MKSVLFFPKFRVLHINFFEFHFFFSILIFFDCILMVKINVSNEKACLIH